MDPDLGNYPLFTECVAKPLALPGAGGLCWGSVTLSFRAFT